MKRILQISVFLMLCMFSHAGNVTKEQALQKASQFMQSRPRTLNGKRLSVHEMAPEKPIAYSTLDVSGDTGKTEVIDEDAQTPGLSRRSLWDDIDSE